MRLGYAFEVETLLSIIKELAYYDSQKTGELLFEITSLKKNKPFHPKKLEGKTQITVKSQRSTVKGQPSKVKSQQSKAKSQRSKVNGQRSTVKSQKSTVKSQRSTVNRQWSTVNVQQFTAT